MNRRTAGSIFWTLLALVSLTFAALAALGVVLSETSSDRWTYGILWTLLALAWLGVLTAWRRRRA